ncbi:RlpA-like double-psi beta-barrel-protein domain-containing protein-containing protein [Pseudomassariella vexata]|uniref:RlpA-like double-psi beta-barrel-protein domain-containing protein-containing protein n=1 Tax=Pseudomassariella vexata TaxID=1141098 RepID=A0A1Y2EBG6_9PEZI|nr:RlpA-like double-psi beta-barrel-protein domain-containing protein-containing protein [Pseudomassariella vexata]ORY68923.1 RlpA-like double-psi beta-barrel-protein domain-containing protein-containing protein [Pseudomassariella vexata]
MHTSSFFVLALAASPALGRKCRNRNTLLSATTQIPTTIVSVPSSTNAALPTSVLTSSVYQSSTLATVISSATKKVAIPTSAASTLVEIVETTPLPTSISTSATSTLAETTETTPLPTSTSTSAAAVATTVASTVADSDAVSGSATFYGGNVAGGTCSFTSYTLPSSLFGTAFSGSSWDTAAHCGQCVEVTGPDGDKLTAMIVDQCPECEASHLDLFQNAFETLADVSKGVIDISYEFVECGITTPISLRNKEGTSAYWFSMQVINANVPVTKLEVSTDGGSSWTATERQEYNFFENQSGFGTETVSIRITGEGGKTIVVDNVSIAANVEVTAASNF